MKPFGLLSLGFSCSLLSTCPSFALPSSLPLLSNKDEKLSEQAHISSQIHIYTPLRELSLTKETTTLSSENIDIVSNISHIENRWYPLHSNGYSLFAPVEGDNSTIPCGERVKTQYRCSEDGCEDLAAGYINYIFFQECIVPDTGTRIISALLLVLWMLFLLHIVESTTNEYFVTSLQLAVAILKLSPNVAGVTFLAVGNAACDVIASIAAFATGVPKVGVGTTLGAGIFVTTAVIAAVSFVSDVRLARRSFIRDVVFFIITVIYLLFCTIDGVITFIESIGFIIIYIIFVLFVAGGRWISMLLKNDDEIVSGLGSESTGGAGDRRLSVADVVRRFSVADVSKALKVVGGGATESSSLLKSGGLKTYNVPAIAVSGTSTSESRSQQAMMAAYQAAAQRTLEGDIASLRNSTLFGQDPGSPEASNDRTKSRRASRQERLGSIVDDLPGKPSKWTEAFYNSISSPDGANADASTSGYGRSRMTSYSFSGGANISASGTREYLPFQMPRYHRKVLATRLAMRLAARGMAHEIVGPDGKVVNVAEIAIEDIELAAQLMTAAVAAEATRQGGKPLTFEAAADAAALGASRAENFEDSRTQRGRAVSSAAIAIKPEDLLAELPEESKNPVSASYLKFQMALSTIGPQYHHFMCFFEVPITIFRDLTIPLLHAGTYKRRMTAVTLPFSFALLTFVMTTHILKGVPTMIKGVPVFIISALVGAVLAIPLYFFGLPRRSKEMSNGTTDEWGGVKPRAESTGSKQLIEGETEASLLGHGHDDKPRWWTPIVKIVTGEVGDPMPTGIIFVFLLILSFLMSLIWLLLIANELVGTALAFGKILNIPDTVMGLAVLAVGNSINDLAASVTIAREGYPSMAVAGAYAGPMFNVIGGIGLPMLIYTATSPDGKYNIGKNTPIVWAAFAVLLTSLVATVVFVPLAGFRITQRIGQFLLLWFVAFIFLVIGMGSVPSLSGSGEGIVLG
jgi:Ca2+/Na+ antiporter